MSSARANIRARAARACTVLAEAGERTYGRVAGATRAPFSTAAANLRLLSKIHVKLPRPTLSGAKKRSPPVGAEQPQAPTPTTSADLAPTPVPGSRPRRLTGAQLMSRGRSALRGGLRAAAKAARKPPRAALGVVRAVARRKKGDPPPQQDSSGEPSSSTIVTTDRDIMKKELKKVTRERDDAVSRLNAVSQSDQPANYGTLSKHGVSVSDKSLSTPRDYESIKLQCEKAMSEVQGLLKQNVDLTRKYENCMKEVDYYKKQERAAYTALQNLRMQYEEVVAEKQKLEREVTSLQTIMEDDRKEIADLRRQQQEAMSQEGSGEAINQLYMTTMRKYEAIKDEYDSIRKRYSDLVASHSNNISKLELTQEEVSRLKKQYDEVLRECNEAVREKNCLKQQCTKAITEWDSALREKNKLQEELLKIREKYDEMMKEMNTHLMQRQHLNKDLKRLQEERNAAMQEYTLVMSERDTVHKEMDKLQEELSQASKKIKTIEQSTNDSTKERESLLLQIEMLKREIAASLHDRDKAIKECNDLRERFGAKEDTNKEWEGSYKDHDNYKQEREMTLKEGPDLDSSSHNMYSKAQKERLDNLDQANQEIDRLRKTIEKLQSELQEAQQEAEVSKRRRDWAFSERDKIVQERESIRAHCDKLRRERDRAVSELAEALRDSDDMKKQRNEASKELKELKERLEAEQEKAAVVRQLAAHNHSRDSAIDTDMQEWETDILHLPIGVVSDRDVGFVVAGGADDPHYGGNDGAIYVTHIAKDGPFEGKLRLHDQIINVNGVDCQRVHRSSVYAAVVNGGGWVQMTVRRRRSGGRSLHTVHLHCPHTAHHGLTLHTGVYIANILPGSPAARESNLAVGDRVLNINGKPVDNIGSCEEAQCLLDAAGEVVQLTTLKSHGSSSLSDPLSSSSSGHNITEDDKSTSSSRPYSSPTSPSKETGVSPGRSGSRELVKKLMPGSGGSHSEDNSCKRYGSSEKVVYNVTKAAGDKGSGTGPFDLFKNMVKPRRHSKERAEERSESREKDEKKKHLTSVLDHEAESAIAQLDSVNNSYHHKSGSNGGTSTTKRSKKREKDKSGGTWPKYRGGGVSTRDANSSTIMYTERKRERPQLTVFFPNPMTSQYSCEEKPYESYHHDRYMSSRSSPRGTPTSPRSQQLSPYNKSVDISGKPSSYSSASQVYSSPQSSSNVYPSQEVYSNVGPHNTSIERKSEDSERDRDRLSSLTSDTSLDFSVKSGKVGKAELEYYVKKNILKYPPSDSESIDNSLQISQPPVYGTRPSPLHHGGDRTPNSRIPHPHSGLYSPPNPPLRSPQGFAPYPHLSHFSLSHPHQYPHSSVGSSISAVSPRYSSPPTLPVVPSHYLSQSRSGDSIFPSGLERDPRDGRGYYESRQASSPTPVGMIGTVSGGVFYHSPSPSLELPGHHKPRTLHHLHPYRPTSDEHPLLPHHSCPPSYHDSQRFTGTMPRKKEDERIRIPSNASVASKSSGGKGSSLERTSERGSPMPFTCSVETVGGGGVSARGQHITHITHSVHNPHYPDYTWQKRPHPGEIRNIDIEKSAEPLGIQIRCLENGGVFVSAVTLNSLASQVGLCVGDQLLEVCGINLRSATKQSASTVLSQCGTSVTMLVQYNPEKYQEAEGWVGSSSSSSVGGSRSGTPTPRNSPKPTSHDSPHSVDDDNMPPSSTSTLRSPLDLRDTLDHSLDHSLSPSARSTLTRPEIAHVMNSLKRETFSRRSENGGVGNSNGGVSSGGSNPGASSGGSGVSPNNASAEPRLVYLELNKSHNLGIQMVGGNALGIFVHAVPPDSPAAKAGLRPGDHILEYNGVDLRHATAEQAAFELAKPADNVKMLVQYNYQRYEEIQDKPGDSFYIRALFDRLGDAGDSTDLRFRKEDILYVDNTMFNNVPGQWRAWVVDEDGQKSQCGTVPSKDKVEEEMRLQRSVGDLQMDSSRRGSTSARRSFFKRKKHSRSSSRDSKELASFSDASLNSYTESTPMHEEPVPHSYIRVERLDYLVRRPVVMVGPLWEIVCDKLVHDYPHNFTRCVPEVSWLSCDEMETAVQKNLIVDYRRRGSHFEATTVSQVKEICDKSCHGILDISLSSVERLHRHNIYPIVLLLKFRHHKQIREVCDSHLTSSERISQKEAKEMFELANKMEQEYKHVISAVIPAAVNMPYISTQVKSCVDQEQSKTLWVPSGSL